MKAHQFLLCLTLSALVLFFAACGDDDDDDDDDNDDEQEDSPEDIITAIVEEMTEGQMESTAQALEDKVFPHISEDYEHAGFDKGDMMDDALEEIEEDDVRIDSYELSIDVDLNEDETSATVSMTNDVTATMEAGDDLDFDVSFVASMQNVSYFVLEDDDEWRVIGDEPMFNKMSMDGGDQSVASDLSDIAVSVTELSAGGSLQITGDLLLPDIDDDFTVFTTISLGWGDERYNAQRWWDESEVSYFEDISDFLGQTYTFDFMMPDDGDPTGLAIPASLPPGADSIEARINVIVQDTENIGEMIRVDALNFNIPLKPLSNQEPCSTGATAGGDGLWALTLESDDWEMLNLVEIADLRIVANDVYGAVVYAQETDTGAWEVPSLEVIGELDGQNISFGFEVENISIHYAATLAGTEMTDGQFILEFTQGEDVVELDAQFTGRKMDNRCGGTTPEDMDGETLVVNIGEETQAYSFADNDGEVQMSSTFSNLTGVMIRNAAVLLDDETDGRWLMLGFYDDEGGFAALMQGDTLSEGSFTLQ